jgi:hypothetical protein
VKSEFRRLAAQTGARNVLAAGGTPSPKVPFLSTGGLHLSTREPFTKS